MPADTFYMEVTFEITSINEGDPIGTPGILRVRDIVGDFMTGFGVVTDPPGWSFGGSYFNPLGPDAQPFAVEHTLTYAQSPLTLSSEIDGTPMNFDPSRFGGYVANMAGREARIFQFGVHQELGTPGTTTEGFLDTWKIGSAPGLADYLDWNAANDAFGPLTVLDGDVEWSGGRIHFQPPLGGAVQFDFLDPWPTPIPPSEYPVSFVVGGTRVARDGPSHPTSELTHAFGVLPDLALSEGCRIVFGTFDGDGSSRVVDGTRGGILAVERFDVDADAPD